MNSRRARSVPMTRWRCLSISHRTNHDRQQPYAGRAAYSVDGLTYIVFFVRQGCVFGISGDSLSRACLHRDVPGGKVRRCWRPLDSESWDNVLRLQDLSRASQ